MITANGVACIIAHRHFTSSSVHCQAKVIPYSINNLRQDTATALTTIGHSKSDAEIIADVLMFAELRGNNQGIIKLVTGGLNFNPSCTNIVTLRESTVSARIDGGQRIGMVVLSHSVSIAIEKAKKSGIAVVGCSNYASATGAMGYWAKEIASNGLIGIVMSQCNEMVAPHGSFEPIFGTNPISIGIPTTPRPQILDMATSASAYYGIKLAEALGQKIPSDIAYDSEGKPTTNPADALNGAIRVFDRSFKGSHLALMVELLAGALTGAAMEDKLHSKNWGSLIIVIDPELFGPKEEFVARANAMCERVKSAKKLEGVEEIVLPGERGDKLERANLEKGTVDIGEDVVNALQYMIHPTKRP